LPIEHNLLLIDNNHWSIDADVCRIHRNI
jgi:hypothetical protein